MRRLIINADDFGLTPGVNRAIIEAISHGVVTSTTLMANAQSFAEAASAAKNLNVGCHVMLVDGAPVSHPGRVSTLLKKKKSEFRDSFADFARSVAGHRIDPEHVALETEAQIRKLQDAGLRVTHIDSHKHVHMFPSVLKPMLEAARGCGVMAVRNPFAPVRPLAFAHLVRRPRLWKRYSQVRVLRGMESGFRRTVADMGFATPDGTFGIVSTGALDLKLFEAIVGGIPEGTWEFVCHPGYNDADLQTVRTRLRASRAEELKVLTSPAARAAIQRHGIQLISYRDLSALSS